MKDQKTAPDERTLKIDQEAELALFLREGLKLRLPPLGRSLGGGLRVTDLPKEAARVFKARNDQAVLLSYEYEKGVYPLSIFFFSDKNLPEFGHCSLLVKNYKKGAEILTDLEEVVRKFFTRTTMNLLESLHLRWGNIEFGDYLNANIFWNDRPQLPLAIEILKKNAVEDIPLPVFPSVYHYENPYLKHQLEVVLEDELNLKKDSKILVMGAGAGLEAFLLQMLQPSQSIEAVDINPIAILNMQILQKRLSDRLRLVEKTRIYESDLFSKTSGPYDLILFNAPFANTKSEAFDLNKTDHGGKLLRRFIEELPQYLAAEGRALLMSSPNIDSFMVPGLRYAVRRQFTAGIDAAILEISRASLI